MTQFLNQRFSVYAPGTDEYRNNWDRIFGGEDQKLQEAVLERALELNTKHGQIVFSPRTQFDDLGSSDKVSWALLALAAAGHFQLEYRLSCADGHMVYAGPEFPTSSDHCRVCDAFIDMNDEYSFDIRTNFILRR
jgi:hypothetical protein